MTALADRHGSAVLAEVVDVIATRTLYDPAILTADSHLEGELGIDSIVLESIVGALAERFGLADPLPATARTVGELVELVAARTAAESPAVRSTPDAPEIPGTPAAVADATTDAVLAAVMRHTQYRRDQLDLDASLEGELGIDSVILEAVLAELSSGPAPDGTRPGAHAGTLRALIRDISSGPAAPSATIPAPADTLPRTAAATAVPAAPVTAAPSPSLPVPEPQWDERSMKDFVALRDPDLFAKTRSFATYRRAREQEHLYWYGMPLQTPCRNRAVIRDELSGRTREYLMFASNNYLGLANHPKVLDAICDATRVYGATNTGCRLIGGTNVLHKELERRLAAFKQREACIVFPGGYSANVGTISALCSGSDTVIVDKYNHMSIVDGVALSGAGRRIYQHNDMTDLERVLARADDAAGRLVVADGVFSMHGDVCDLPEIVRLAREYGARVLIDDAHATGVLGTRGSGTAEHFGLKGAVDLELGTMSKTLAGMGGFVVADADVVEYLRYYAHSYVFAATIPAPLAAGLIAAIDVIESEPERISRLWHNIRRLRASLRAAGFDVERSDSAVLPIVLHDERLAMEMGRAVRARGLFCQTVVFPGVALGDARLRISVTCEHTDADLDEAADIFLAAAREVGVRTEPRE